jgi:hypothetical protein
LYEEKGGVANLNLFASLFGVQDFDVEALLERVGLGARGRDYDVCFGMGYVINDRLGHPIFQYLAAGLCGGLL